MNVEKMAEVQSAYDEWYKKACLLALNFGHGTTVSGKAPNSDGVYPDPVITIPNGFSFTVGHPKER